MTKWTEKDVEGILTNPFYAIQLHPTLCVEHPPIVSREQWIAANARMIKEMGARAWLARLLDVLEGDFPTGS